MGLKALPQLLCPLWLSITSSYSTSNAIWTRGLLGNTPACVASFSSALCSVAKRKECLCRVEFATGGAASTQKPFQALHSQPSRESSSSRRDVSREESSTGCILPAEASQRCSSPPARSSFLFLQVAIHNCMSFNRFWMLGVYSWCEVIVPAP